MSHPGNAAAARPLYQLALELNRQDRRVSAYNVFRRAMAVGSPNLTHARLGAALATRFADAGLLLKLRNSVGDTDWLDNALSALGQRQAFDPDRAARLLSVRAPRSVDPVPNRLCYALSSSPPSTSGYASRTQGMAEGLTTAGFEVVGLTRPGYPMDRDGTDIAADETVGRIRYHRISEPRRDRLTQTGYVEASIEAWQDAIAQLRPAAVLAASNWESALPAGIAARRLGLPFFYEIRGFWEMTRASKEEGFETTPLYASWARLEAVTAAAADHVFTLTEAMREELTFRGVPPQRITLLPNACDPQDFTARPRDAALSAQLGLPGDVPVIGYVGSFVSYEGLELLIEACGLLRQQGKEFRLLLVGSESGGPGAYSEKLRKRAQRHGIGDWLIMPGRVPHDAVPAWYSLIDVAPFPRMPHAVTDNVSPLKPMEAMAMRKAVAVSDLRALSEMVQPERTGLTFRRADADDLAAVLGRLLSDPDLRRRLGDQARDFIEAERTWTAVARKARAVITRLSGSAA